MTHTHTQTDLPNTTHSLSPADRQLLGISRMTHTHRWTCPTPHTDRPTANRRSWYDTHIHRWTCPTPHTHCLADRQLIGIPRMTYTRTQTDLPNTTHSLSPANQKLLGIPHMTLTQRRTCPTHTLTLSSRPTATQHSCYDTHTQTDGPAQHHTLSLSSKPTANRHSSYDTHTHRRTCRTPHTKSLQQTDSYSAFLL